MSMIEEGVGVVERRPNCAGCTKSLPFILSVMGGHQGLFAEERPDLLNVLYVMTSFPKMAD